jgi:hypothetical protein
VRAQPPCHRDFSVQRIAQRIELHGRVLLAGIELQLLRFDLACQARGNRGIGSLGPA